jgi:hypothetical protein
MFNGSNHSRAAIRRRALITIGSCVLALVAPTTAQTAAAEGTSHVALKPPKIRGEACATEDGVTVVVDFRNLLDRKGKKLNLVKIGCAEGDPSDGFQALLGAGFDVDPDSPFVCEIDHKPLDGSCAAYGFWSYNHGERGGDWEFSSTGAGGWDPPAGSLEGWSWWPYDKSDKPWGEPRVKPHDLFPPL